MRTEMRGQSIERDPYFYHGYSFLARRIVREIRSDTKTGLMGLIRHRRREWVVVAPDASEARWHVDRRATVRYRKGGWPEVVRG